MSTELVMKLVDLLSTERSDDYHSWLDAGSCLYNINSNDFLPLWIDFSMNSCKFLLGECEREWEVMTDRGFDIISLKTWAEYDNFEGYNNLLKIDKKTTPGLEKLFVNVDKKTTPGLEQWFADKKQHFSTLKGLDQHEVSFLLETVMYGNLGMSKIVYILCKDEIRRASPRKYYYLHGKTESWVLTRRVCDLNHIIMPRVSSVLKELISVSPMDKHKLIKRKINQVETSSGMARIMITAGSLFDMM
jgi:hypothetical protein